MTTLKESTDVWFCAFLMKQNIPILKYDIIARGKVKCYFQLSEEQWRSLKLTFNNSEIIKYKALIEQLKDLSY